MKTNDAEKYFTSREKLRGSLEIEEKIFLLSQDGKMRKRRCLEELKRTKLVLLRFILSKISFPN